MQTWIFPVASIGGKPTVDFGDNVFAVLVKIACDGNNTPTLSDFQKQAWNCSMMLGDRSQHRLVMVIEI